MTESFPVFNAFTFKHSLACSQTNEISLAVNKLNMWVSDLVFVWCIIILMQGCWNAVEKEGN